MTPLPLPPVADPYQLPFHYGALHNIGLDYLVDPDPVREVLAKHHPALTAAHFDGQCLVSLNYQLYFAQYQFGGGITQEIDTRRRPRRTAGSPAVTASCSPSAPTWAGSRPSPRTTPRSPGTAPIPQGWHSPVR